MQSRKVALFKGLRDSRIQGFASSAADIKKHIEACENKKLVQYHREGKTWAKAKMGGIILNRHIDGAEMVRKDCNFHPTQVGDHFMFDWDCNVTPFTPQPEDLAKRFVETLDEQVPGFAECCVFEKSCSGALHGCVPCFSGNARRDLAFYEKLMGVECDASVLNASRCYIAVLDILVGSYDCLFREVPSSVIEGLCKLSQGEEVIAEPQTQVVVEKSVPSAIEKSADLDLLQAVTCELIDELGGYPQKGDRNQFLYKAAAELRSITDCSPEQIAVLLGDHQYFGLPESEALATIRSACKKSEEPKKSEMMRTSIDRALMKSAAPKVEVKLSESCTVIGLSSSSDISSSVPEELPTTPPEEWSPFSEEPPAAIAYKDLPKFARILVQNVPEWTYNHVWNGVEPALATYLCGTEARSIDGGEPLRVGEGFISISVSGPSTGKSSRSPIFACITKKLHEEDAKCRAAMQAYNELSRRTKTADLPAKPEWTSQILGADCSAAALMMRLRAATGALLINADELSMLSGLQSNTSDANTPLLLAFCSERHVVERSTDVAEAGAVNMRLNIAGHGTPYQFEKFAANGFHNGLLSRLSLSKILPAGEFTGYGSYDGYQALIDPFIEKLS